MASNLKQQLFSGVFYTALAKYSGIVISLVVAGVLARLLTPDDFGIVAIATVIIAFFSIFTDMGISPAIVQNKALTEKDLSDIFSFTLWMGAGLSVLFFAAVLAFSLFPGKILTWVGKILNPIFLVCLGILVIAAIVKPMGTVSGFAPAEAYTKSAVFTGFLDGYNPMDALASLAFGIVVITVIRDLGVKEPKAVAKSTVHAGIFSCLIMAAIYLAVTLVGAQSRGLGVECTNGGEVFALVANHYFGKTGGIILAATFTFACLKTAVGLITSCSETFVKLFPKSFSHRVWAIIFSIASLLIANLGLNKIIDYSVPVLMFLYPLAITLILLGLFGNLFGHNRWVYGFVTGFTLVAAVYDFLAALPKELIVKLRLTNALAAIKNFLPLSDIGLGWVVPAAVGLVIGIAVMLFTKKKAPANA